VAVGIEEVADDEIEALQVLRERFINGGVFGEEMLR
jgi:hypothetical protein